MMVLEISYVPGFKNAPLRRSSCDLFDVAARKKHDVDEYIWKCF